MSKGRQVVVEAVRPVLEPLERRRLLTGTPTITFSQSGTRPYVEFDTGTGLSSEFQASAAHVTNLTQDADVAITPISTTNESTSFRWGFTGPLTSGWYEAYVRDGSLASDEYEQTFSFLSCDFNGDHVTNNDDLTPFLANFGQSGKTFADGDADYDGTVDFNDFLILQNNFNLSLPALSSEPGSVSVGSLSPGTLAVGWTAGTDTRDGFKVYRSDDWGNTYTLVQTIPDPDARTWQDDGTAAGPLTIGKPYWYRVRAYTNAAGASASVHKAVGVVPQPLPTAVATPATVTGTTTQLGVLGEADIPAIRYTWTCLSGPAPVTFDAPPNTHAAKNTTATFTQAGTYAFRVRAWDGFYDTNGLPRTVDSNPVTVEVVPTATTVDVTPSDVTLPLNGSTDFTAYVTDQFGQPVTDPVVTWQIDSGPGSMSGSTYTAPATAGTTVIQGACGLISALATVAIENAPPALDGNTYQATTGTTVTLSVNGIDDGNETDLVYTWSIEGKPDGTADPILSANASNSAKQTVATFSKAGFYEFDVTVDDGEHSMSLQCTVSVQPLPTTLTVDPPSPTIVYGTTTHFTASAKDQFGQPISNAEFKWSARYGNVAYGDYYASNAFQTADHLVVKLGNIQRDITIILQSPGNFNLSSEPINMLSSILRWNDAPGRDDFYDVQYSTNDSSFVSLTEAKQLVNASTFTVDMDLLWIQAGWNTHPDIPNYYFRIRRGANYMAYDYSNSVAVSNPYFGMPANMHDNLPPVFNFVRLQQKEQPDTNKTVGELPMKNGVSSSITYRLFRSVNQPAYGPAADGNWAALTVPLFSSGTATPNVDFIFPASVTIPANASSVDFEVQIASDNETENSETFRLGIQSGPTFVAQNYISNPVTILDGTPNLHIDSNNDGNNDWYYSLGTALLDDPIESDANLPGKYINISNTDSDGDFIPDFADGFSPPNGTSDQINSAATFVPIVLQVPDVDPATARVKFTYDGSNPGGLLMPAHPATADGTEYIPGAGSLRIWKKGGAVVRNGKPVSQGGDYLQPGESYTITELGGTAGSWITLYVEAVAPAGTKYGDKLPITVTLSVAGTSVTTSDTVNVTPVYNPDGWRFEQRKRAGFKFRQWDPTQGYMSNFTNMLAVYNFYRDLYLQSVNQPANGIAPGRLEWAGIAKVAGKSVLYGNQTMSDPAQFMAGVLQSASAWSSLGTNLVGSAVWTALKFAPSVTTGNLPVNLHNAQTKFLGITYAIFNDIGWQLQAYETGGLKEMERLGDHTPGYVEFPGHKAFAAGALVDLVDAWTLIDHGAPNSADNWAGNRMIIKQEQLVVAQPLWDQLSGPPGNPNWMIDPNNAVTAYGLSVADALTLGSEASAPFPGALTFPEWSFSHLKWMQVTNGPSRLIYMNSHLWSAWKNMTQAQRDSLINAPLP